MNGIFVILCCKDYNGITEWDFLKPDIYARLFNKHSLTGRWLILMSLAKNLKCWGHTCMTHCNVLQLVCLLSYWFYVVDGELKWCNKSLNLWVRRQWFQTTYKNAVTFFFFSSTVKKCSLFLVAGDLKKHQSTYIANDKTLGHVAAHQQHF